MFKQIPEQGWLLLAIAASASVPVHYIYRYIAHSPSGRDITQAAEDLSWRTSGLLARNLAILGTLAAIAVFIFTPAALTLAHSPSFWPVLIVACGLWALVTVARGFSIGRIEPFARGFNNTYERQSQPKRFWVSMGWNTFFGCLCLWMALQMNEQAPVQALKDRCWDTKTTYSPQEELSACNQLIGQSGTRAEDMANFVAARGSAYFRLGDYRHAMLDYTNAVRLDPNDSSSYFNLGLAREKLGDRAAAIVAYSAAIRLEADNADAYFNRGLIFLDSDLFDQAVVDFTQVHKLRLADPLPVANRGIAYVWKGDLDRAEQDFVAARALDPSNLIALRGEALLSMKRGDMDAAVDRLTAALSRDSSDSWSLAMRSEAYRRLGEYEKMRADADELQRLSEVSNDAGR